jgi:hypothetical protein
MAAFLPMTRGAVALVPLLAVLVMPVPGSAGPATTAAAISAHATPHAGARRNDGAHRKDGRHQSDGTWALLEEAHEIINIETVLTTPQKPVATYKSAGDNPIPDELWPDYEPPLPYIKNTTRNLQFNESQFLASPGEPVGTTTYVTTPDDGYTWAAMSVAINAMWPYNPAHYSDLAAHNAYYAGNLVVNPPPGVVKITANYKGQNMKFWANEDGEAPGTPGAVPLDRHFVIDQWGNEYIMHASGGLDQGAVAAAFAAAVLPPGWEKSTRQLAEDLILRPAEGADGSFHYLVWRDSSDNTYHQIGWSPTGSLSAQVEGMPIWGGQGNDVLAGDVGGIRDDLMHGGGGNDLFRPGFGNDEIWGDAGVDTVVLPGRRSDYEIRELSDDLSHLVLSNPLAGIKTIKHCEFLIFDDKTVPVKALHSRRSH